MMEWYDIEVVGRQTVKFSELPYVPLTNPPQSLDEEECFVGQKLGGIIRHGEWAWMARNSMLQIVSLRSGQSISSYEFCEARGYESCCIKCVEEIFPCNPELMVLAVVLESFRGPGGGCSYVALYSVELSCVLSNIELSLHATCARFMNSLACRRTLLQNYDGCLAIGSEEGVIVLLDLNIHKVMSIKTDLQEDIFVPCHIVEYNLPLTEIHRNFRHCQQNGKHFGFQIEVIESPCPIQCILPIDLVLGLAVGLEDGRLVLYDLAELQIFYVALPAPEVTMSAIVKMDFVVPPDDPRPCLYIWTLHENGENLHAALHSLMYEKRIVEDDGCSTYFETFQSSSVRLQLPLEATKSVALSCQAISTQSSHDEEDLTCLCIISWLSVLEGKNKLILFDLNQWYKEEMPPVLEYGRQPNYLAGYILNGECTGLHTLLNSNAISHFNSMQRFEEHFYPNSLSFECSLLHTEGCRRYNWEGAQNRVINLLRSSNAAIFLEPNFYFNEVIRTRLMPQFIDLNTNSTFSRNAKYEVLLSTALEHNCVSLLRDCAKSWVDGSFMGNFTASTGLSLSTMTDWIWKRATFIKSRCNELCKSLFEFGGYPLDNREQKELGYITRQLKLLSNLLKDILVYAKKQIPERVYSDLENKYNSLCMASSYQDILLWLFNIGLLPEASSYNNKISVGNNLVPYPYKQLKEFYREKRYFYSKLNESFVSKKTGSCKLLYIDSFIDHVCRGNVLHEYWLENDGDGLYPPNSLEAMLRIMLVPDMDYDSKYAILLYFFLDLNIFIDEEVYRHVVANFIKFPSVFKLSATLIKTVQAFWNLDHDHCLSAVDEFISPFNKNQSYSQWQVELLIEVLLNKNANNLALRVLESESNLISSRLKLKTLLANELISDAFHFVRSKNDDLLLETFFSCCLSNRKFGVLRDLALSEREGIVLQNILKKTKIPCAESLHFVYLLQKSKYIEAVSYMEELSNKTKITKNSLNQISQMDTPNIVLSAFNTTMTPVTQGLTDVYFRIKNKIKKKEVDNKSPVPLSCQLIKQNANGLLGGIYHSTALSAHFATYYWGELEEETKQAKHVLSSNNAPFLRRPQMDTNCTDYPTKNIISYPKPYKANEKRSLIESELLDNEYEKQKLENKLNPKKKRRLIGQEILDDLTHCLKVNKPQSNSNTAEVQFSLEYSGNSLLEQNENPMLTTPLLNKQPKSTKEFEENVTSFPEIHSILKTNTTELDLNHSEAIIEEEKNLRFRLPTTTADNKNAQSEEPQNEKVLEEMDITENVNESEKDVPILTSPKIRQITRAVSEESNNSSASSSNQSEDNFYSPISSQNNSKLDISNLSKCSYMSGPQPRKPLVRLSLERAEKSLTPEVETNTKAQETSSLNMSYVTASRDSNETRICPRRSLERVNSEPQCAESESGSNNQSENTVYVTALDTFTTKPKDTKAESGSADKTNDDNSNAYETALNILPINSEVVQENNFVGNIASQSTFSGSKINEFSPKVCSSKVEMTPATKLLQCSTVIGSLTAFECTNTDSSNTFARPTVPSDKTKQFSHLDKPTEEQKRQMLDTTLDMSSYDISILNSTTSMQQTKSSLLESATVASFKIETFKENNMHCTKGENIKENKEEQMECDEENMPDEQLKNEYSKSSNENYEEDSNNDCIVLLSSSSSSNKSNDIEEEEYDEIHSDNEIHYDENSDFSDDEDSNKSSDTEEEEYDDIEIHYDENSDSNVDEELSRDETVNPSEDELDLSIGDPTQPSPTSSENEEIIQVIEDSSSDIKKQEKTPCFSESDSDDVKLIEETDVAGGDDDKKLVENKEISKTEEITHDYTKESEEKPIDEGTKSSAEISLVPVNKISDNEIRINESISTSTTVLIHEEVLVLEIDKSKHENSIGKKDENKDEQNAECANGSNKQEDIEFEKNAETDIQNVDDESKTINKPEKILELDDESITQRVDDCTGTNLDSKIENKPTQQDSSKNVEEKFKKEKEISLENKTELQDNKVDEKQDALKDLSGTSKNTEDKDIPVSLSRRSTRGISVPPQTITETEELSTSTSRMPRNLRASSLQPNYKIEEIPISSSSIETAKKNENVLDKNVSSEKTRSKRGSSVPPSANAGKVSARRRSALLNAINEDSPILDSPSSRTRLRTRLNSMDSELESPIVGGPELSLPAKRSRKGSISSNASEVPLTPKRTRRSSISSQPEANTTFTPRTLRARSVLSVQEEESESIPDSPKPEVKKIIGMKRKKSIAEEQTVKNQEHIDHISPKSDHSTMSEASYSNTRRLTRTQLAIMEKSAALSQTTTDDATTISPPPNKRAVKSRTTRSSNAPHDSDDAESVSSKISTTSSVTTTKRRVTRSSTKEKDDASDEVASIASSVGSEKPHRPRRSKDKSSPNTILAAIPEDAPVEPKKRGRTTKN